MLSMVSYFILFYLFVIDKQPCLRKHPANIMFYKCAMELLFVYPFLFIYYTDDSFSWDQTTLQCIASQSAKFFSFQSQFALLGGELYFLVVVMDLHMQCSNPFASFQHYFGQYNIIIICFSLFMAGILATVGNKGEYIGSGTTYGLWIQDYDPGSAAVLSEASRANITGDDDAVDEELEFLQGGRNSDDLTDIALVKMFMFYGWVIGIYLYATYVITFVSMRLREGLSRTLSTRLSLARRAQKYVTGYTIYWVIVGGVDFLNYMLSGQYNQSELEIIHVFMGFCVSGRGVVSLIIIYYTNYDDWVTSSLLYYVGLSNKFTEDAENDDAINEVIKQEIAQLPHLNSTLRAEVLLFTTQGIRCVIQDYNRSKQEFLQDMSEFDDPDEGGTSDSMQRSKSVKSEEGPRTTASERWEGKHLSTNKVASRQYVFNDFDTSKEAGAAREGMISHVEQGMQDSGEVEGEVVRHKADYSGPLLSAANLDRVDKALRRMSGNARRGSSFGSEEVQRQSLEMMNAKRGSISKAPLDAKETGGGDQFNPMQTLGEGTEHLNSIKEVPSKDCLAGLSDNSDDETNESDTFNMGEEIKRASAFIDSDPTKRTSKRLSEAFRASKAKTLKKSVFILSAGEDGDDENMKAEPLAQYNAPIKEEERRESVDRVGRSFSRGSASTDTRDIGFLRRATTRASVFTANPSPSFIMDNDGDDPEDAYSFAENRDHIRSSMITGETTYEGQESNMTFWEQLARSWALCQSNLAQRRNFIFKVLYCLPDFRHLLPPVMALVLTRQIPSSVSPL